MNPVLLILICATLAVDSTIENPLTGKRMTIAGIDKTLNRIERFGDKPKVQAAIIKMSLPARSNLDKV